MFRLGTFLHRRQVAKTARQLIEKYGDDAWLVAGKRCLLLTGKRDSAGALLWREVAREVIQTTMPTKQNH